MSGWSSDPCPPQSYLQEVDQNRCSFHPREMHSEQVHSRFDILPDNAIRHNRSTRGSNTSAVGRNQEHNGDTKAAVVWELVWMVFG